MYEYAGLDTWIGGDNDSTGYYFDYENNNSNNIVLKSVKKDPIAFNLAGEGTKENPYLIRNMKEWKMVAGMPKKQNKNNENSYYKIANDIDLSSGQFYMIGSANDNYFTGKVDGNLSKLYNLNMDIAPADNVGIFGYTSEAEFVGLNLENITIKGRNSVGGLIGYTTGSGTKVNEVVGKNINVTGTGDYIGGIIGYYGTTKNVIIKSGSVTGSNFVYPIQGCGGSASNVIIEGMSVTATYSYYGTIGYNYNSSTSYNSNKVIVNETVQTSGFDSEYIDDLDYYTDKVETRLNGDKNNTGYYFDYVYSKGGIYLVNKYDKQESDDDTPSSQKNCKVTYGAEVKGCYRYTSGTHDGYKYRSPSLGELDDGNGGACTGTGLSAAFRKKVYYSCN